MLTETGRTGGDMTTYDLLSAVAAMMTGDRPAGLAVADALEEHGLADQAGRVRAVFARRGHGLDGGSRSAPVTVGELVAALLRCNPLDEVRVAHPFYPDGPEGSKDFTASANLPFSCPSTVPSYVGPATVSAESHSVLSLDVDKSGRKPGTLEVICIR
jgi:hypothetical protein